MCILHGPGGPWQEYRRAGEMAGCQSLKGLPYASAPANFTIMTYLNDLRIPLPPILVCNPPGKPLAGRPRKSGGSC